MRWVVRAGERDRNGLASRPRQPTDGIVQERDVGVTATATVTVRGCGRDRGGQRRMMAPGDGAPGLPVVAATPMRNNATAARTPPPTRSGHRQNGNRGDGQDSEQEKSEALHSGRLCMVCFALSIAPDNFMTALNLRRCHARGEGDRGTPFEAADNLFWGIPTGRAVITRVRTTFTKHELGRRNTRDTQRRARAPVPSWRNHPRFDRTVIARIVSPLSPRHSRSLV
jgi:hypothetical protein